MKKVILIGGAPTVGKTYLARLLAQELQYPWISTDTIRGMMRQIVHSTDYPNLFNRTEKNSDQNVDYLKSQTVSQITQDQINESKAVWRGVEALITTDYTWRSYIIEGVAILPEQVAQFHHKKIDIKPVFITGTTRNRIVETFTKNGLWEPTEKYPDEIKQKDIDWVLALDTWFAQEAQKYNFLTIDTTFDDTDKVRSFLV